MASQSPLPLPFCLCVPPPTLPCPGGAGEQHGAGAELPAADLKRGEPGQPAALLEHVQQVRVSPPPREGPGQAAPSLSVQMSWF